MSSIGSIVYEPLLQTLTSLGHSADSLHVINNASVVPDLTDPPQFNGNALQKDIHQIRDALLKLITEQHRDVVLVAHSYGGTPAIYAASGLWQHQRAAARRAGGVVKVALIASSLTLPGGSVAGDRAEWQKANGQPGDEGAEIQVVDGVCAISYSLNQQRRRADTTTGTIPHTHRLRARMDERHHRLSHPRLTEAISHELRAISYSYGPR